MVGTDLVRPARGRRRLAGLVLAAGAGVVALAGCSAPATSPPPAPSSAAAGAVVTPSPLSSPPLSSSPPSSPPSSAAALTPPNCPTASLRVDLGQADGAMGTVYRPLVFTNTGSATCQLRGFPGVSYVAGDDGHQVGPAATEDGPRADQVNLAPNESAHATLAISNAGNYDTARCGPVDVRGLRVYPPGDTASAYLPYGGRQTCANDVVTLTVRTMQPGPS